MNSPMQPTATQTVANLITTTLAAALNLLVLLVICFILMPRVEMAIEGGDKNFEAAQQTQEILREHTKVIKRLNDALDAAAAKAKAVKPKS